MNNERILEKRVLTDAIWAETAKAVLAGDFEAGERIKHYGQMVANAVAAGNMDVKDLRTKVEELNKLDKEAVEHTGYNKSAEVFERDNLLEAIARGICHGAGNYALNQVRSKNRLLRYTMNYRQRLRRFELGQGDEEGLELLVLGNYAGKLGARNI